MVYVILWGSFCSSSHALKGINGEVKDWFIGSKTVGTKCHKINR